MSVVAQQGATVATQTFTNVVTYTIPTVVETVTETVTVTEGTTTTEPPPPEWIFCANEGQRCDFTGMREVRYGKGTIWTAPRVFTDGVNCTNGVFGDPLVGTAKECQTRATTGGPPPPPPPPGTLPSIITQGGTYSGDASSVRIATTQPVTIVDSTIQGSGDLVTAAEGANVTIERTTITGGAGRAFTSFGFKSVTIRNCTITGTTGIRLDNAAPAATILVTRNRVRNIQEADYNTVFFQTAHVTTTTSFEVSWNEVVNEWGETGVEDNVNLFASTNGRILNNYIEGSYPWQADPNSASGGHSGSGIMVGDFAGGGHEVAFNQVIDTTNAGIGVAGGNGNSVHDNRVIADGRLDDGTPLPATNVGIVIFGGATNSTATSNTVGWLRPDGTRADTYIDGGAGSSISGTTALATVNRAAEAAEWQRWLDKLAVNGILVGT